MLNSVTRAYTRFTRARPLVRPTYNQFEVTYLPPYGDPEVHIPSEVGTYVAAGWLITTVTNLLRD